MTETGRIYSDCIEPRQISTRAFGRPFGGLEAKVVDDREEEVPRGTEGELLVRWGGRRARHGFFAGYLKNPEATEEAWRGGWFHTGDVVRQMPDGMLVFLDRKKNIIRRSGENIAAAEVEACLQAHHGVSQVAVLAVPDEIREEEVMACVVPMPGVAPARELAEHLQDWCLEKLAYFKAPGWVLFVEQLPTTGTQKIQKSLIFPEGRGPEVPARRPRSPRSRRSGGRDRPRSGLRVELLEGVAVLASVPAAHREGAGHLGHVDRSPRVDGEAVGRREAARRLGIGRAPAGEDPAVLVEDADPAVLGPRGSARCAARSGPCATRAPTRRRVPACRRRGGSAAGCPSTRSGTRRRG